MSKKAKVRVVRDGSEADEDAYKLDRDEKLERDSVISFDGSAEMTKALADVHLQLLHVNKKAPSFSTLMRRLKHVRSSGPHSRDEMNER